MRVALIAGLAVSALLAAVQAGASSLETIRLNWKESSAAANYAPLVFVVRSVSVEDGTWSVRARVQNHSTARIAIVRQTRETYPPRNGFAILVPQRCPEQTARSCLPEPERATRFSPRLPSVLRPGQSWAGTFGGRAELPKRRYLAISFGYFVVPGPKTDFDWVTQRRFRLD